MAQWDVCDQAPGRQSRIGPVSFQSTQTWGSNHNEEHQEAGAEACGNLDRS